MNNIISIVSGKGGVGKSIIATKLAATISKSDKKVVVIDGNIGLRCLDLIWGAENIIIDNIIDVIKDRCSLDDVLIQHQKYENLFLLPTSQTKDSSSIAPQDMEQLFEKLTEKFDYIIIDSPTGVEQGFTNSFIHSTKIFIVLTPDILSVRAGDKVNSLLKMHRKNDISLIINRYRSDLAKKEDCLSVQEIEEIFQLPIIGIIPEDEDILIHSSKGDLLSADLSFSSIAFDNIAKRIQGEEIPLNNFNHSKGIIKKITNLFG